MEIFISYSQKDERIALLFKYLFEEFDEDNKVFLSSHLKRDQQKYDDWKKNLETHLGNSDLCVVLVSPNSLNSQWVHYETGYASASGKTIIRPIRIKGVSPENSLWQNTEFSEVDNFDNVQNLILKLFPSSKVKQTQSFCRDKRKEIDELIDLCKERCVYFVGNKPQKETESMNWNQDFVNRFLDKVTRELLERGIRISSFPTVEAVGEKVFDTVMEKYPLNYEISGLFGVDNAANNKNINIDDWKKVIIKTRESYLENKNSMIIIGGNEHTAAEFYVANKISHLEVFPIPCMGGAAERLFNQYIDKYKQSHHPCINCKGGKNECDRIESFVERLCKYVYLNEDERES